MKALQGLGSEQQSFILMPLLWCKGIHPPGKRRMHLTMGHQRDPEPQSLPGQDRLWHEGGSGSLGTWGQSSEANGEQPGHIQPSLGAAWSWEASIPLGRCRSCRDGIGAAAICCWPPTSHLSLGPVEGTVGQRHTSNSWKQPTGRRAGGVLGTICPGMVSLHVSFCSPSVALGCQLPQRDRHDLCSAAVLEQCRGIQGYRDAALCSCAAQGWTHCRTVLPARLKLILRKRLFWGYIWDAGMFFHTLN